MSCLPAFDNFLQNYPQAYLDTLSELPRYYSHGEVSPCVADKASHSEGRLGEHSADDAVSWRPVKRDTMADFSNVEHALELNLSPEISAFYGQYFSAPLLFNSPWGMGELLQVWNEDDFTLLQQNIIGHLMMKKKLKQSPTWFIGLLEEGDKMLTIDNRDGSVWIEIPGELPSEQLAPNLNAFIETLSVRIAPPVKHETLPMPALEHPGILVNLKRMWRNLFAKR